MRTNTDRGKMIRLLCFLLTGLLVMTVSAAVYNYMGLQASPISAETAKVVFSDGTDATAAGESVGTNGTYAQFTSLSGWPNATRIYENATVIMNTDSAIDFPCQLSVSSSLSGSTASVNQLYLQIYDAGGTLQGALDVVAGNTTAFTIPHGAVWRCQWNIQWKATALSTDTVSVTLSLRTTGEGTDE